MRFRKPPRSNSTHKLEEKMQMDLQPPQITAFKIRAANWFAFCASAYTQVDGHSILHTGRYTQVDTFWFLE